MTPSKPIESQRDIMHLQNYDSNLHIKILAALLYLLICNFHLFACPHAIFKASTKPVGVSAFDIRSVGSWSWSKRLSNTLLSAANSASPYQVLANSPILGGDIIRIRNGPDDERAQDSCFLSVMGVPTFAVPPPHNRKCSTPTTIVENEKPTKRLGLEGVLQNRNAFLLTNALSSSTCESIIELCEYNLKFGNYNMGKNNHGAMQIVVSRQAADTLLSIIGPHVDLEAVTESELELQNSVGDKDQDFMKINHFSIAGINRRFRVYRYLPNQGESFAPHIDAGFPPGGVSFDDTSAPLKECDNIHNETTGIPFLVWDASHQYSKDSEVVSRLTVLIYLNEDFSGGHTKFYCPQIENDRFLNWNDNGIKMNSNYTCCNENVIASIQPRTGSILVFPQAVSEESVERARHLWPMHEGAVVTSGNRPKYVIRTDVLFQTKSNVAEELKLILEKDRHLFQHDAAVREVFLPRSNVFSTLFLHHIQPLYNPHMGVENVGPWLYSFVRFTKVKRVVEVGAGYSTIWILQALKDNEQEIRKIGDLDKEGRLRLLDYPFGTAVLNDWESTSSSYISSSLLCIDNCEHQRETASSALTIAQIMGLNSYVHFLKGDAFDALHTHFSAMESIDLLWCDFGVGSRMVEYSSNVWKYIKPGGFLVCHSTLTNTRTRDWLEGVRGNKGVEVTGIPSNEYVELSLLEPHKRFQNSLTILQKRTGIKGPFTEPIYSEYA